MNIKDLDRKFIKNIIDKRTDETLSLYRVINAAGVPYSVLEDKNGNEIYFCETCSEGSMLEYCELTR